MKFASINKETYQNSEIFEINKGDKITIQWNRNGYGVGVCVNGKGFLCSYGTALDIEKFLFNK